MTETATREDLEERLKDSPGCETVYGPCANPVAWVDYRPCCNLRKLICDLHKRLCEERAPSADYPRERVRCAHCDQTPCPWPEFIPV